VPFLDNLDELVEEARIKLQGFLDFFTGIMDMDGKINDLIEPVLLAISDAIPTLDVGCDESPNVDDCIKKALGLNFTVLQTLHLGVGGFDFKMPDAFAEISETLTNEMNDIMTDVRTLFDDVDCNAYKTVQINIPEYIEENFNFSASAFPIPNCPINVQVCTDLRLQGLDNFSRDTLARIEKILSRRNRKLSADLTGEFRRSLSVDNLCQTNWTEGVPADGGITLDGEFFMVSAGTFE